MRRKLVIFFGVLFYSIIFLIIIAAVSGDPSEPVTPSTNPNASPSPAVVEDTEEFETHTYGVLSVTDGDTIRVDIDGLSVPVRLIGIDTPEINHPSEPIQCYGPEAKEALEELILGKEVVLETDVSETDKYERLLRYVWLGETLVNEYMTKNGYAFSSEYPPDTKYQLRINAAEEYAKNNSLGIWDANTCNGDVYTGTYKDPNKVIETTAPVVQPVTQPSVQTTPPATTFSTPSPQTSSYSCSCSKTCSQMSSCEEAYYQLNTCGCSARDGDHDGVPCESICR